MNKTAFFKTAFLNIVYFLKSSTEYYSKIVFNISIFFVSPVLYFNTNQVDEVFLLYFVQDENVTAGVVESDLHRMLLGCMHT